MPSDPAHGKVLFDNRVEYPLPAKSGVRDYVFFVPKDAYGDAARTFFKTHYGHHSAHDISSLEDLISVLYADVTQGGVQHIREVVVVTHGNMIGLKLALLNAPGAPNMGSLTALSLACLQQQMLNGALDGLKAKRAAVVSHLTAESWVTLRVCRFGLSAEGMYALYSFFGGNADVYAPRAYQFFGPQAVGPLAATVVGTRFPSQQAYHQHLVLQHFVPDNIHTPDRQATIVDSLADPASFAAPFSLATRPVGQPVPADYAAIVDGLNHATVSEALSDAFIASGVSLAGPPTPVVRVNTPGSAWTIKYAISHPGLQKPVPLYYHLSELPDADGQTLRLWVQAQLVFALDAHQSVPLQLFLEEGEHNLFIGKLFAIAMTTDGDPNDAPNKVSYDAFVGILNANGNQTQNFGDGAGHDLRTIFESEGRPLSPAATISAVPNTPPLSDLFEWKTWRLDDAPSPLEKVSYLVKLEHPYAPSGGRLHALSVYLNVAGYELEQQHYTLSTWFGTSSDTPGVELPAYLDRLSTDDLVDLATYLRSPYRPERVFYLSQAEQALARKGSSLDFFKQRFPNFATTPLPSADTLLMLSQGEQDDLHAHAYEFDFQTYWSEVKASARSPILFQNDLFLEEPLAPKFDALLRQFGVSNGDPCTAGLLTIVPDSPVTDRDQLKQAQTWGVDAYFATTAAKSTVSPPVDDTDCTDFRAVIAKWKEVQDLPVDQLRAALVGQQTPEGKSYWEIILDLREHYSLLQNMTKLTELSDVVKLPDIPDPTDAYDMAKFVAAKTAKYLEWEVAATVLEEFGTYELVFTVPMKMWYEVASAQVDAERADKARGLIAAIRQWLRALEDLTFLKENDFRADDVFDQINVRTQLGPGPYYLDHYYDEARWVDFERGDPPAARVPFSPDAIGQGYEDGLLAVQFHVWPAIERLSKQVMSDLLHEAQLDSCKLQVLGDAGFLSLSSLNARVVRAFARKLLDTMPGL